MILAVLFAAFCGLWVVSLLRINSVHRYRMRLLDQVSRAAKADIDRGLPWEWRYETYATETQDSMTWRLWRRIDSFYTDRSFLDPDSCQPVGTP